MSKNGTTVDIGEEVDRICAKLGFDKENVGRLDIRPATVHVEVFKLNEEGSKYMEIGNPAIDKMEFKVTT